MVRELFLLCFYLSIVSVVAATTAPDVTPSRIYRAPAISPQRRRRTQNNKNGGADKNANPTETPIEAPTEAPIEAPTEAPTIAVMTLSPLTPAPTPIPSIESTPLPTTLPTASPVTERPTTLAPSLSPTIAPTEQGVIGYLNLTFSMLAEGFTATSVLLAQEQWLIDAIKESLDYYLCTDTDISLLSANNEPLCPANQRALQGGEEDGVINFDSILYPHQRRMIVDDRDEGGFRFTSWLVEYPVMKIGTKYQEMAQDTSDPSGLVTMQSVSQLAVNVRIEEGDMDARLSTDTFNARTAVLGNEIVAFSNEFVYSPLHPAPLHPLRIAGISMLVFSTIATLFIVNLAKQRRIQKEWDAEFKERGKGGLVTEAGLDYMLEAGRHQSTRMVDDEEGPKLLLPGYLNQATPT